MSVKAWLCPPIVGQREQELVFQAIESGWVAPAGPQLTAFENTLATKLRSPNTLGVSSGTAALHLAMELAGIEPNDVVFCPTLTFAATAFPILYMKAQPWFVDADLQTWNMSAQALEQAISECRQTANIPKAIIWVATLGNPTGVAEIKAIAEKENLVFIEDAAEGLGSHWNNQPIGSWGHLSAISFNGNKIITTSGGGLLVSPFKDLIDRARLLAQQARLPGPDFIHNEKGFNYRLSNILAAIGLAQLEELDNRIQKHRADHSLLKETLAEKAAEQVCDSLGFHNRWLSGFRFVGSKNEKFAPKQQISDLIQLGFEARPLWVPLHLLPPFKEFRITKDGTAELLYQEGITYPVMHRMKEKLYRDEFIAYLNQL